MRKHILTPVIEGNMVKIKLPQGLNFSICYVTRSSNINQPLPPYQSRLEIGHDYQIRNGVFTSRKTELLSAPDTFIYVAATETTGKKCKACRKDGQTGSFCSSCGQFLF